MTTSTSSWPSSTPMLNESSDVSRCEPANCIVCCRPHERPHTAEWNHQAEQEQQVIGAVENVEEPQPDEAQHRLMPPRIEWHQSGVAFELVRADHTARRHEPQRRDNADAEAVERHVDGEMRLVRLNRILEQHVENSLFPEDRRVVRQPWTVEMRQRVLVRAERTLRFERH